MAEREHPADAALTALFAAETDPRDDGFSAGVMDRIGGRIRRRRLVIAIAVGAGALIAAWPLGQLLLASADPARQPSRGRIAVAHEGLDDRPA